MVGVVHRGRVRTRGGVHRRLLLHVEQPDFAGRGEVEARMKQCAPWEPEPLWWWRTKIIVAVLLFVGPIVFALVKVATWK